MEQLWAPWRMQYVANPKPTAGSGCFICDALAGTDDRNTYLIERGAKSVVILNRFPYNNGHLLIAPNHHLAMPSDIDDETTLDLQKQIRKYTCLLTEMMNAEGFNVGLNLGKVAGAGLPGHLHWHVVPRWNGDTNFMPILSDVRVIVQSLDSLWSMLRSKLTASSLQ
jgi:ATP adenylyltransferase